MRKLCSYLTAFPRRLIRDCIRNHLPTLSEKSMWTDDSPKRPFFLFLEI